MNRIFVIVLFLCQMNTTFFSDSKGEASYNNGAWKNLHDIFGSHLWAFPLNTITTDGLHWEIGYPKYYDGPRLVVLKSPKNQTYVEECIKEIVIKR
jgi:hypothetical protein